MKGTAVFVRKALNLKEVACATYEGIAQPFTVVEELVVSDERFCKITNNLMATIPEFAEKCKGGTRNGVVQAVKVINEKTGAFFLTNPEGYPYARYVAICK